VPVQSIAAMLKDTPITPRDELTKHKSSDFRRAFWQLVAMFAEQLFWDCWFPLHVVRARDRSVLEDIQ
jgi:hypothetical protein